MEILRLEDVKKYFPASSGFLSSGKGLVKAIEGVSLSIHPNRVFALVGESGCGKSTIARLILRLLPPTAGRILFKDKDINDLKGSELMSFRRAVQIIFQDPFASLNPRMRISEILEEPFIVHKIGNRNERKGLSIALLNKVGLSADAADRYPHEFSGGQRQRICIARAISLSPEMLIADEPLSALDVSIQAQIINLFLDLKKEYNLSMLFISHDLNVVRYLSDEVAVMYLGRIVEQGSTDIIYSTPLHPYTELLLLSAPSIVKRDVNRRERETGEAPSPINIPPGCAFHPRCPKALDQCREAIPDLAERQGRRIACHLYN